MTCDLRSQRFGRQGPRDDTQPSEPPSLPQPVYWCKICGKTFCSTTETPYHSLHYSRNTFDDVVLMSVEGVSKASITRVKKLSWNTVARWLTRAAQSAERFNDRMVQSYELRKLQGEEVRTFTDNKGRLIWVLFALEVWSRQWLSCVVGRRSYRNTRCMIREAARRGWYEHWPLVTTDGFQYYAPVICRVFGGTCAHGQVLKQWADNRVIRVDRNLIIGSEGQLDEAPMFGVHDQPAPAGRILVHHRPHQA